MPIEGLNHIAIIPDGNRRWAQLHGVSRLEGHQRGAEVMHQVVESLLSSQVKYLTLWGFSTDNWRRSESEIEDVFSISKQWLISHTSWCYDHGVRLRHLGHINELPDELADAITLATDLTRDKTTMTLNIAFNYTGRVDIVDAVRKLIADRVSQDRIDEHLFSRYLDTDGTPDVDLVIRTAGEYRVSNFLLWQSAYSEFYFTDILWPDFNEEELEKALNAYSERKRRFGGD